MTTKEELPQPTPVRRPRTRHPQVTVKLKLLIWTIMRMRTLGYWIPNSHVQPTVKFTVDNTKTGEEMETNKVVNPNVDPVSLPLDIPSQSTLDHLPVAEEHSSESNNA